MISLKFQNCYDGFKGTSEAETIETRVFTTWTVLPKTPWCHFGETMETMQGWNAFFLDDLQESNWFWHRKLDTTETFLGSLRSSMWEKGEVFTKNNWFWNHKDHENSKGATWVVLGCVSSLSKLICIATNGANIPSTHGLTIVGIKWDPFTVFSQVW